MAAKDMRNIENKRDILSIELKAGNISCRDISWIQTNRRTSEEKIIDPFRGGDDRLVHLCGSE